MAFHRGSAEMTALEKDEGKELRSKHPKSFSEFSAKIVI
jgi:hypothetical protein